MDDRLITSSMTMEDEQIEYSLRPRFLNEYIGQHNVKEHMRIYIEAAKHRGEPLTMPFSMARRVSARPRLRQ